MKNKQIQKNFKKSFFVVYAVLLIFAAFGVTIAAADTSVAWTKDIGDVTAADMSEDGSVIYAAVGSQIFVYDAAGVQQNTFTVGGNVVKLVCTADGSKAALYTDGEEVYYIDNGALTWTQSFTAITDIDISNAGSVLVVESNVFHKYLSDGTLEYDSIDGVFDFGVIDPNGEYAIVGASSGNTLQKYILTTTTDYWGKIGSTSFNPAFQDFQDLLIIYTNETSAIILNAQTLNLEIYSKLIGSSCLAISNNTLSTEISSQYNTKINSTWTQATATAEWSARTGASSWTFDDKMWIGGGSGRSDVWYSSDGVTWTQATAAAGWSGRSYASSWTFNGKMWIGGGIGLSDVWYSSDGVTWTQATANAGWGNKNYASSWVFNGRMYIGGGQSPQQRHFNGQDYTWIEGLSDIWYSSDGVTWTRATAAAGWTARYGASSWTFDDKMWIGGGTYQYWYSSGPRTNTLSDIWYSSDGITWTRATAAAGWTARYGASSWTFDGNMWIGGGSGRSDVWYSSDGVTWTQATANAGWSGRTYASSWTFDGKMWIGGGLSNVRDVWSMVAITESITVPNNNPTYIFYNYTGTSPQHTQTTYTNEVPFTGTTELRTKPTLSIYDLQTTKTLTGNIEAISLSDRGDWLGTATASRIYHDQIIDLGFGTEYYAALGSTGTVYDVATANSAAMSILGQGQITDIYSMSASRVGTYTAGGAVTHVDIADKNALWAASGGEDGKVYVFSKDASSNWYLEYSSDSENPITALRMSARGEYILAGRTNSLTLYQTNTPEITTTEFWFTLYAYKDSDSYRNAAVNVSVYSGNQWNFLTQGLTDSVGKYVILLTAGQNYKFDVGNGEKIMIYQATPNVNSQTISIYSSPISSSVTYGATWDTQAGGIQFKYADSSGQTQNVNVKIMRTDTWETVYDETFTGTESINETLPIIDDTTSYKVEFSANRVSGVTRNNFFVSASQDIIPIPLDKNILNVLFSCLLILIAGLFSYMSAIRGAVVVAMCAIFFTYLGWLTIPWHWLIIAIVIAMVAGFTQRRS